MYRTCCRAVAVLAASLLTVTATASARPITVSGKLDHAGYTIVVLGYDGKTVISHKRTFRLTIDNGPLTLELVSPKGAYAGPVVVGYKRRFALEAIKRTVRLGTVKVLSGAGYARVAKWLPTKDVDTRRLAYTAGKAPLGNGRNFGFVNSPGRGASGAGLDRDQDGVPDAFDVANSGRKILNAFVRSSGVTHSTRLGPDQPTPGFSWMSQIFLPLEQTVNADASGVTTAQIDAMLQQELNLKGLGIPNADLVELDCDGLSYCSADSSASVVTGNGSIGNPITAPLANYFDGAGFPVLRGPGAATLVSGPGGAEFSLMPHTTSDQIKTGDTPILRTTSGGVLTQTPEPIQFVFDTVPALSSYDDGAGDSGTISYPAPAGEPGTQSNPIPVEADSSGDVDVALKFWRPQRKGIAGAGEPAFMDIGHLEYTVDAVSLAQAAAGPGTPVQASSCSSASVSTTDPNLSVSGDQGGGGFLVDSAADQPVNPANQLSFTVDLTKCMKDGGAAGFPVGTQGALGLKANAPDSSDHAVQNIWIKRVR